MTLKQFASEFAADYPGAKLVYIAVMPSNQNGHYDLEVEISHDAIGTVWDSGTSKLKQARQLADRLEQALARLPSPVNVVATRERWEEFQPCSECGQMVDLESGIDCTECEDRFCDSCYDTGKGDGCHCHEVARIKKS
jgi:hypothetical protein